MKKFCIIWMLSLLQYLKGDTVTLVPDCMTLNQLNRAMKIFCLEQRENRTLWNSIIQCHRPISEEFMRSSAEALCPVPKFVENPTDTKHSIEDVFFNICGMITGNSSERHEGRTCLLYGRPGISSHEQEVIEVKKKFGDDVPCKIGECIINLGYDLGS